MTPQSARDALRALAAACADIPPPQVQSIDEVEVLGAVVRLPARGLCVSREKSPTVVFFHEGGWVAGDLETHGRQARLLAIETGAVVARSAISWTRYPCSGAFGLRSVTSSPPRSDQHASADDAERAERPPRPPNSADVHVPRVDKHA